MADDFSSLSYTLSDDILDRALSAFLGQADFPSAYSPAGAEAYRHRMRLALDRLREATTMMVKAPE